MYGILHYLISTVKLKQNQSMTKQFYIIHASHLKWKYRNLSKLRCGFWKKSVFCWVTKYFGDISLIHFIFESLLKKRGFCKNLTSLIRTHCVVVTTTAQLHSTKPKLRFYACSNPAHGVAEIRDGENLWQWPQLEIRLSAFRRSTIPQKQFLIIINSLGWSGYLFLWHFVLTIWGKRSCYTCYVMTRTWNVKIISFAFHTNKVFWKTDGYHHD